MNDITNQILIWTGVFATLIIGFTIMLNFFMKGFLFAYLRVKASRGKLVLAEVESMTDNYFIAAKIEDQALHYKTRAGVKKIIVNVTKRAITSIMGVSKVTVNESGDFIYMADGKPPEEADLPNAAAIDSLMVRILMTPEAKDYFKIAVICLLLLLLASAVYIIMREEAILQAIAALKKVSGVI